MISSGFSYYCLRERSLKLSSRMDLLLRRSFLCRCWYQTTPPRARAMSSRTKHMAIKIEDTISTFFMGIFMPSIFTFPPPMSLRITAFPISLVMGVIVLKCSSWDKTVKMVSMPAWTWSVTWQCISHLPGLLATISTTSNVPGKRSTTSAR